MSALEVAADHARSRARLAEKLRLEARESWAQVDPARISETWARQIPRLMLLLTGGQHAAAVSADRYVTEVLVEQGINPATEGRLDAASLSRIASDGRPLESLLAQPGITAKVALAGGETIERAMAAGNALAQLIAHTQVADAGTGSRPGGADLPAAARLATSACWSARAAPAASSWPASSTAGTRVSAGILKCDCVHIPAAENDPNDMRVNPKKTFESMSAAEQDQVFTKAGAQAIRDGGDMSRSSTPAAAQADWLRRGASDRVRAEAAARWPRRRPPRGGGRFRAAAVRHVRGRDGARHGRCPAGREGRRREDGRPVTAPRSRSSSESIYQIAAGNRDEALRLLKRFGYIL
jgi:hypothetical protein